VLNHTSGKKHGSVTFLLFWRWVLDASVGNLSWSYSHSAMLGLLLALPWKGEIMEWCSFHLVPQNTFEQWYEVLPWTNCEFDFLKTSWNI
jgi:hypothetical protein